MKTKEENEDFKWKLGRIFYDLGEGKIGVLEALESYDNIKSLAIHPDLEREKEEFAVGFADWINKNEYEKIHGNRWCIKYMSHTYSTPELLELYKNRDNGK